MENNQFDIHARCIDKVSDEDSNFGVLCAKRDCEMTVEAPNIVIAIGNAENYLGDGYIITAAYEREYSILHC